MKGRAARRVEGLHQGTRGGVGGMWKPEEMASEGEGCKKGWGMRQ